MKKLILGLLLLLATTTLAASTVLLFDASGSMGDYITNTNGSKSTKIDVAKNAANYLLDRVSSGDEIALIVFYDCSNIKTEVAFTTNTQTIRTKIATLKPTGGTPIAKAIKYADSYVGTASRKGASIVMLTDGKETCDSNSAAVSAASNATNAGNINVINVVGFNITKGSTEETQLKAVATAGKGNYYPAEDKQQLGSALTTAYQQGKQGPTSTCCLSTVLLLGLVGFVAINLRSRRN
jgi:Mg-chelatase subunit ChlD